MAPDFREVAPKIFDLAIPGDVCDFTLKSWSEVYTTRLKVLESKKHDDWSYSFFCQDPFTKAVTYLWLKPESFKYTHPTIVRIDNLSRCQVTENL